MNIITVDRTDSTNTYLAAIDASHGTAVMALRQTAGRGQRGNRWESEPGMNVTLSVMLRPRGLSAARQFSLSQAVALGVRDAAASMLSDNSPEVEVKWPNDIYTGHRKLAGLLIENVLSGSEIERSIAGIGFNVNQTVFLSDAPNPVSLAQLTGRRFDVGDVARRVVEAVMGYVDRLPGECEAIHDRYLSRLWRRSGVHMWSDPATGQTFEASIEEVSTMGMLTLKDSEGHTHGPYAFKEIAPVL